MGAEAQELVRRVELNSWFGIVVANVTSALLIVPAVICMWPIYYVGVPLASPILKSFAVGIPYLAIAAVSGRYLVIRPKLRPALRWLLEGREPTSDERQLLATQPRRLATGMLVYWVIYAAWALPFARLIAVPLTAVVAVKLINGLVFLGFVAWTLSYLLVERAIRPALAIALSGAPSVEPRTLGVFGRLLVAWTAAAGMPFWNLIVILYGLTDMQRAAATPYIYVTSASAAVAGVIATIVSSRAITDPLEKVRSGMRAVELGELEIDVPVDEASEIGVLQMGFNRMALGLRERERMREIFGHHVGTDVAKRAIEGEFTLGGELVEATAMFVDMIASSRLAQDRRPDEVVTVLNAYFATIVRCVAAEDGYVLRFEGDGALCVFGAPAQRADHAERALLAARTLRRELRALTENVDAAIGISSGQVVHGNVGAADRYEYTVIGDPVNEASRLTDEAKYRHTRVLASGSTLENAGAEAANWGRSGTISLRGRARPTVAFEPAPT